MNYKETTIPPPLGLHVCREATAHEKGYTWEPRCTLPDSTFVSFPASLPFLSCCHNNNEDLAPVSRTAIRLIIVAFLVWTINLEYCNTSMKQNEQINDSKILRKSLT